MLFEGLLEHVAGQDDGDVLVGCDEIEEEAGRHGGGDESERIVHGLGEDTGDAFKEAAGRHDATKTHGAKDEPDGIHHAAHAACGHEFVEGVVAHVELSGTEEGLHNSLKLDQDRGTIHLGDFSEQMLLENQAIEGCHQGGQEKGDQRRNLFINQYGGDDGNNQGEKRNIEFGIERLGVELHQFHATATRIETGKKEDQQGDGHGRYGSEKHVADMGEEFHADCGRGQHGRIGQGRHLITEIGAGNDGTGNPAFAESLGLTYSEQSDTNGGYGGPGTTGHDGDEGTDDAGADEEEIGMDNLDAVINHGGHDAADHPGARKRTNDQENEKGCRHPFHIALDGRFEILPGHVITPHSDGGTDGRGNEQRNLATSAQRTVAEGRDGQGQNGYEHHQGREGNKGGGSLFLCH